MCRNVTCSLEGQRLVFSSRCERKIRYALLLRCIWPNGLHVICVLPIGEILPNHLFDDRRVAIRANATTKPVFVRIYPSNASEVHRPSLCMIHFGAPCSAQ